MTKKQILAILQILFFLLSLSGCGGDNTRVVAIDGGLSTERDAMIYEAAQNTQRMEPTP